MGIYSCLAQLLHPPPHSIWAVRGNLIGTSHARPNALDPARAITQMGDARPVVLEGTTPAASPRPEPRNKGAAAPPPTSAPSAPSTTARVAGATDGTLANSSGRPVRLGPPRQWGHTATHTHPLTRRRTLVGPQHGPAPPRRAREPIASSRRPAPCQLLPEPRVVPSPEAAGRAQA